MSDSSPVIPLHLSETLHVTLAVLTQELERRTDYPTYNLRVALEAYIKARNKYVTGGGWSQDDIKAETLSATEALTQYLEDRALDGAEEDFQQWGQELFGEHK